MKKLFLITLTLFLSSCLATKSRTKLVLPNKGDIHQHINWTDEEKQKAIAIRHLQRTKNTSTHLMRLQGKEFAHYHDRHDLSATILSGHVVIHYQDHDVTLTTGDVMFIPRGTYHWAENIHPNASDVFVTFSPAFDGKDRRKAE